MAELTADTMRQVATSATAAADALARVADALNACARAGLKVRLRHGIVETRHGYVLPAAGEWVARTRTYTPFTPDDSEDDD